MMPQALEFKFDRLHVKLTPNKLLLFAGDEPGRRRDLHFTQFFEPRKGQLHPHFSFKDRGQKKRRFLQPFNPKRAARVLEAYEQDVYELIFKGLRRVEPTALEDAGWFIVSPEAFLRDWAAQQGRDASTCSITTKSLGAAVDSMFNAAAPAGLLHQLTDEHHPIRAFRLSDAGDVIDSGTLFFLTEGPDAGPGWHMASDPLIPPEQHAELMRRHFPKEFWEVLLEIDAELNLGMDREKLLRFADGQQ